MDNARALKNTFKEVTWKFRVLWEKLAMLHCQDFDNELLLENPRLSKLSMVFLPVEACERVGGWCRTMFYQPLSDIILMTSTLPVASALAKYMSLLKTWCSVLLIGAISPSSALSRFSIGCVARLLRPRFLPKGAPFALLLTVILFLTLTALRSVMTFAASLSISLLSRSRLDSIAIRRSLRVSAVQFRGAIARWNFIRKSWVNRREATVCYAHA